MTGRHLLWTFGVIAFTNTNGAVVAQYYAHSRVSKGNVHSMDADQPRDGNVLFANDP